MMLCKRCEKQDANRRVYIALTSGDLVHSKICEECGEESHTMAHHENYNFPLEIEWLCSKCHGRRHWTIQRKLREGLITQGKYDLLYMLANPQFASHTEARENWI